MNMQMKMSGHYENIDIIPLPQPPCCFMPRADTFHLLAGDMFSMA